MKKLSTFPKWCKHIRKQDGAVLHIYDPIFAANFYFFLDLPFRKYSKEYFSIFGCKPNTDKNVSGHFSVEQIKNGPEVGCIYSIDKGRSLMHECLHATMWVLEKRGVPTNHDADEVIAYYQEFLMKWATKP